MAIAYKLHKIDGFEDLCYVFGGSNLTNRTEAMILATVMVGMPKITADNADEFYARITVWESIHRPLLTMWDGPAPITPADVRAYIGLETNATKETRAQWRKRIIGSRLDTLTRRYREAD